MLGRLAVLTRAEVCQIKLQDSVLFWRSEETVEIPRELAATPSFFTPYEWRCRLGRRSRARPWRACHPKRRDLQRPATRPSDRQTWGKVVPRPTSHGIRDLAGGDVDPA